MMEIWQRSSKLIKANQGTQYCKLFGVILGARVSVLNGSFVTAWKVTDCYFPHLFLNLCYNFIRISLRLLNLCLAKYYCQHRLWTKQPKETEIVLIL